MKKYRFTGALVAAGLTAALLSPAGLVRADTTQGQLVYAFTYGSDQNVDARDQDVINPFTSGISHYHGSLGDKGTMTVDVQSKQPDGGLVVVISEQGENTRKALPAMCVVYSDTRVICDPNKTVLPEEYTLLRFLGANFVDPNAIDANHHWAVAQNGRTTSVKADYTVDGSSNGTMQIIENRKISPNNGGSQTTDVQTKIGYDLARSVPTSINEYVTQRLDNGAVGTTTTIYQTTLNLVSDSMAKT